MAVLSRDLHFGSRTRRRPATTLVNQIHSAPCTFLKDVQWYARYFKEVSYNIRRLKRVSRARHMTSK
jgi:hypothetical protein